jgi:glycosyltransferase involved in cell wall biosynthesis
VPGPEQAIRILHITADLVFGGVENWLLNMARLLEGPSLQMDVAVTGTIDARVRAKFEIAGVRVFGCPSTYQPLQAVRNLRRILQQGPYDILHCHMHRGNAHAALTGCLSGVPGIVVHSHLDTSTEDASLGMGTTAKVWLAAALQRICADSGLACGQAAGDCLFGRQWRTRKNWSLHYCGIDMKPFLQPVDRRGIRLHSRIPEDAFVIGHVGRCEPVKNPHFILDLAARYTASNGDAVFVLVGDGSLLPAMEERVREGGLSSRIRLLGARDDVPSLLGGLFDVFLLPSLAEGLPISLLEAQAAGLPALISDRVTAEAHILPDIETLRIGQPLDDWCAALDRARGRRMNPQAAVAMLREAGFGVEESAHRLGRHYHELCRRVSPGIP